jgi:hypothetical protein
VTVSEFAFLALGLMLGVASGAAVIVISTARPPAVNEIRLTVTPNAIPRRRRSTLSEDAFADHSEPARGGPADRHLDDVDDALRWVANASAMRTIVRSWPLPPAGAGDPESGRQGPVRIGGGSPWPAAGRNRLALPASIVASYPPAPGREEVPLVAVPIFPERDVAMAALRDSAARAAEIMMRAQASTATATATVERWDAGFAPLSTYAATASNGGTNGGHGRSSSPAPVTRGGGGGASSGGPCDEAERIADERCAVAIRAREQADAADEAVRQAQRAFDERGADATRAAVAAEPGGMRVAKETAQQAFRRARAEAGTRAEIEAAAATWLTEINRINQLARDAAMQVQRERQASAAILAKLERLTVDADVARAAADAAELTCAAARIAVEECREAAPGQQQRAPMPPITPYPVAAMAQGAGAGVDEMSPLESAVATSPNEAAILRLLRGDRPTLDALVAHLAGTDPGERRRWQLVLAGLVDAIVATSIESSILTFPDGHPFWAEFSQSQSRDVAAALGSLGFRFDGLGGWADDRIPSQRDLSLAAGYAGLDPMRIRRWPSEAETAELYSEVSVAADEYLRGAAGGLTLGELVSALGRRADALTDVWNDWDRLRPLLLAGES